MRQKLVGLVSASLAIAAAAMFGQAPASPKLEFEVASIKPAAPLNPESIRSGKMRIGMNVDGARVSINGMPVFSLLPQVFRVKQYQVSGGGTPVDFLNTERWDIEAKLPDGATEDQVPDMLLNLLVDRFKLAYHRENRERPVYALIVGKTGAKLKEAAAEPDAPAADANKPDGTVVMNTGQGEIRIKQDGGGRGLGRGGATISSPQFGTMKIQMGEDGQMHLEAAKITMAGLAELLTGFVDRPVLDMTELKGGYQVTLDLSMQDIMAVARAQGALGGGFGGPGGAGAGAGPAVPAASDPSGGAIFSAIQKLGLKLDARKASVETIVVDHLEKTPTEN